MKNKETGTPLRVAGNRVECEGPDCWKATNTHPAEEWFAVSVTFLGHLGHYGYHFCGHECYAGAVNAGFTMAGLHGRRV